MKKIVTFFMAVLSVAYASEVEVTADKFYADEKKQISVFEGNVKVVREKDKLTAKKLTIDFDAKKQPLRYIATGNAKGNMVVNEKKYYGEAEKMTYDPNKSVYVLEKKAFLHEIETDKKVYGDFIRVDQISGQYEVDGKGAAPVKFIFKVEDKKSDEKKPSEKKDSSKKAEGATE